MSIENKTSSKAKSNSFEMGKKNHRIIDDALSKLFKPSAFVRLELIKDRLGKDDSLSRKIQVDRNRMWFLSDVGMTAVRTIVSIIDSSKLFEGRAAYSDIWSAWITTFQELLAKNLMPENSLEAIQLISDKLALKISLHTFAVPIFGIELSGIDSLDLGSMKLIKLTAAYLDASGVKHAHTDVGKSIDATESRFWLVGSAVGTERMARQNFRHQAELAVGMLAISAASTYVNGATAFRIGIVMSPEQGHDGRAIWFSWNENEMELRTTYSFQSSQLFKIDQALVEEFSTANVFDQAFAIFENTNRSELEDAIVKCVYWYSEAQRDSVHVMKLIKYWSCVEVFFSLGKEDITKSVSAGLTSVLVYGSFRFIPQSEYASIKKRIKALYDLRSDAVHSAWYSHVSERDVSDLSQWVSWLLINMIAFVGAGYKTRAQVKDECNRLDQLENNDAVAS